MNRADIEQIIAKIIQQQKATSSISWEFFLREALMRGIEIGFEKGRIKQFKPSDDGFYMLQMYRYETVADYIASSDADEGEA